MNVACDYETPMQMLTKEKYIAAGTPIECEIARRFPRSVVKV